jgi:hypothetical protein
LTLIVITSDGFVSRAGYNPFLVADDRPPVKKKSMYFGVDFMYVLTA